MELITLILPILLTGFMLAAMLWDATSFTIPNKLNAALLICYPIAYVLLDTNMDIIDGLVGFAIVFIAGYIIFVLRVMGGGDVKLLAVCALWIGVGTPLWTFLLLAGVLGGPLTIILLVARPMAAYMVSRYGKEGANIPRIFSYGEPVPYGLAIGASFIILLWKGYFPFYSV